MTRVLLLAAGDGTRWDNYLGVPKHLIPIKGEPLIHRTQRMLAERGVRDIRVVCRPDSVTAYLTGSSTWQPPAPATTEVPHKLYSSMNAWSTAGTTAVMFGDVYYTDRLLDAIVDDEAATWHWWARWKGSKHTGCDHGEGWALVFGPQHHRLLRDATDEACDWVTTGRWDRAIVWDTYRIAAGMPPTRHAKDRNGHGMAWDDQTEDFDCPTDWDNWAALNRELW